jgi:hypothetical protein
MDRQFWDLTSNYDDVVAMSLPFKKRPTLRGEIFSTPLLLTFLG